jgi:hypothetical protein
MPTTAEECGPAAQPWDSSHHCHCLQWRPFWNDMACHLLCQHLPCDDDLEGKTTTEGLIVTRQVAVAALEPVLQGRNTKDHTQAKPGQSANGLGHTSRGETVSKSSPHKGVKRLGRQGLLPIWRQ